MYTELPAGWDPPQMNFHTTVTAGTSTRTVWNLTAAPLGQRINNPPSWGWGQKDWTPGEYIIRRSDVPDGWEIHSAVRHNDRVP
jgi:hypothetical protein